jgi:nucleotide-binding universal stress UspA family protein
VKDQPSDGPGVLLVAIDGSKTSLRAAAYAAGLARRQHARLVALFVYTVSAAAGISPAVITPMREAQDHVVAELRQTLETEGPRLGLHAELIVREGNPFHEIVKLAGEVQADAVFVGASMQAGHRFIGSLAVHLVRASRWPVTVVP